MKIRKNKEKQQKNWQREIKNRQGRKHKGTKEKIRK